MSGKSTNGSRTSTSSQERSKYSVPVRGLSSIRQEPKRNLTASLESLSLGATYSRLAGHSTSTSRSSSTEQFKFLSANYEKIRIKRNYAEIEASQPTLDFVYSTRYLSKGRSFGVAVTKVVSERHSDFSFIIGFTSCSSASLHTNKKQHFTVPCSPTGCGGHSQQLKIFNANKIGSKVTVERQLDGEIYFAIDKSMPIRIQFNRNSCDINMIGQELLTPYIQLSGNVLALTVSTNIQKLNIRRTMLLGTSKAYGPPIHKQTSIETNEAHKAFVAPYDVDNKFIVLKYPQNDVKVSVNRLAVLRKNECGERFVFYIDKILKLNARITIQVTKIYDSDKYTSDFEFGVMTVQSNYMEMLENELFTDSLTETVRNATHRFKMHHNSKVNDKYTFTRTGNDVIEIKKNDIVHKMWKIERIARVKNILPFVILDGTVSGLMIVNNETTMKFAQTYELPAMDMKTTSNVKLTNETLLTWSPNSVDGVIVNAKPFDNLLRFIIREVRTSINGKSLAFGLINSTNIGFKTPLEMATCLDFKHDDLIPLPAVGLKFSLYKSPYGKVTLKCDNGHSDPTTLFAVEPTHCYYPIIILNGSVAAIELLPNHKTTIKQIAGAATSCPQPFSASTDDCKICMDRTINSAFVPCGHRFACHDCGKEWMRNVSASCPVCRMKIDILLKTFD
ncbi:uncharacterized protein LOC119068235 [Bradysia coprophila]|uniref:uncharacterized protein LOC119068235 n=1 Tax=Bradysia coprophila TaxID=38358 RepID=UPI00187DA439|nr:uncharacterized protein LOC119068235 [Bradysia coprophila]XP_037027648.1 uncharacterized protein LOC119068235 [Bradysia coprophila]XP_037027649.1 uncharacterized protein LOC119068235 [Bradysia coprophila]XP_037027650.1 uncharacterized protein LOC119068235 [Bradysia coprophila]